MAANFDDPLDPLDSTYDFAAAARAAAADMRRAFRLTEDEVIAVVPPPPYVEQARDALRDDPTLVVVADEDDQPTQRAFVLGQHDLYSLLTGRVRAIRNQLDDGDDLTDVLVSETRLILDSTMTREQIASALVSVMARVAQGEDLLASGAGVVQSDLVGGLPISVKRGGIRYPTEPEWVSPESEWGPGEVRRDEYSEDGPCSSRLTHIPTGIVVVGAGGRSVMENRRRAAALLRSRLAAYIYPATFDPGEE